MEQFLDDPMEEFPKGRFSGRIPVGTVSEASKEIPGEILR